MSRIRDDLHMKAYRRSVGQRLDARLKKSGMKEQRGLFSGMQLMAMKTSSSQTKKKLLRRRNLTSSVTKSMPTRLLKLRSGLHGYSIRDGMVGCIVPGVDIPPFRRNGVKTEVKVYLEDVLESVMKPLNNTLFSGRPWVFQQDSASVYQARMTWGWLQ